MPAEELATRDVLILTAEAILEDSGVEALALREIARRAGLSHNAPSRHFPTLTHLRTAVATRAFARFADATAVAAAPRAPAEPPVDRAVRLASAYVEFALGHPGIFALMWRPDLVEPSPGFMHESLRAFAVLEGLMRDAQARGHRRDLDRGTLAAIVWSTVHGISQLWPRGSLTQAAAIASLPPLIEHAVRVLLGPASHVE